jgi:hypothetical protein
MGIHSTEGQRRLVSTWTARRGWQVHGQRRAQVGHVCRQNLRQQSAHMRNAPKAVWGGGSRRTQYSRTHGVEGTNAMRCRALWSALQRELRGLSAQTPRSRPPAWAAPTSGRPSRSGEYTQYRERVCAAVCACVCACVRVTQMRAHARIEVCVCVCVQMGGWVGVRVSVCLCTPSCVAWTGTLAQTRTGAQQAPTLLTLVPYLSLCPRPRIRLRKLPVPLVPLPLCSTQERQSRSRTAPSSPARTSMLTSVCRPWARALCCMLAHGMSHRVVSAALPARTPALGTIL